MRKIVRLTALLLLWIACISSFFIADEKLKKPPVIKGDITSIKKHLIETLDEAVKDKKAGCAAFALVQQGNIVASYGFGKDNGKTNSAFDPEHAVYLQSSLSKAVTAWGVMKLVQDGKLNLDEPVIKYLKRWRFNGSGGYKNKVTTRRLLSHTAGLVDGYGYNGFLLTEKLQNIEESLEGPADANMGNGHAAVVINEPGTTMSYSTSGYAVLQLLIEEITGKPFSDYMNETVLLPLGMTKSTYDVDALITSGGMKDLAPNFDLALNVFPVKHYTNMAGVSLRSTAHDIALLASAYYNTNPVLTKQTITEMLKPQPGTGNSWSLGHTLYAANNTGGYIAGHGGGSFPASGAEMRFNPANGNAIVLMVTGSRGLISKLADDWMYWETGQKKIDIRNVFHTRLIHVVVVAVFFGAIIIMAAVRKKYV